MNNNYSLLDIIAGLRTAIKNRDKQSILDLYNEVIQLDLDRADDIQFDQYNRLVSEANEILLSDK